MRLKEARVQNYRSIRDTGWFDVEDEKTILVGPNESGKTAVLEALQRINAPDDVRGFDPLRDYPRKRYSADIRSGKVSPDDVPIASARFRLESEDLAALPPGFDDATYEFIRYLDNSWGHSVNGGPKPITVNEDVCNDLLRLAEHFDDQTADEREEHEESPSASVREMIDSWEVGVTDITGSTAESLREWLSHVADGIDESDTRATSRHVKLLEYTAIGQKIDDALETLHTRLPAFVYFSTYFRVRPRLHLRHFANRISQNISDNDREDYANRCLLKFLGFDATELANLGDVPDPGNDADAFERYSSQLDERSQALNAASVRLTEEIRSVWNPDVRATEADTLLVEADGQYLKLVVEDEPAVRIEFDQRSGGFQWLVSFFVVFFAEAADAHANAILLLDEPGLSLHGLKQREFRNTLSRLAERNQTLYTTHSPFLVGPDELDLVRVVEMTDREAGTQIHTSVTAGDPVALLPLQEALGYDLAHSLFMQERNLVLEGLTDYWYLEAMANVLRDAEIITLNERIALVPAGNAGKVVYFATLLHANRLKVAALLDSDAAGDQAASQETLVAALKHRRIVRTAEICPSVKHPEIEDLLRDTLPVVAKDDLGWNVTDIVNQQFSRPIVDIFGTEIADFSKYKLSKAFLRWTREHTADDLSITERDAWTKLIKRINSALR